MNWMGRKRTAKEKVIWRRLIILMCHLFSGYPLSPSLPLSSQLFNATQDESASGHLPLPSILLTYFHSTSEDIGQHPILISLQVRANLLLQGREGRGH